MGSRRDRGYAWVILVASFLCQALSIGFSIGCIGISTVSYAAVFPNATSSELSWIGSLRGSCQFLGSLVALPLAERLGFRLVTAVGSLLAAAGVVASIFAQELWQVYLGFGILAGLGISCPFSTSMAILGEYFNERKHIAFPVVGFGQGVGALVFPPILQKVIDSAGHTNALVFTACIVSINALCGLTFKPLESSLCGRCRWKAAADAVPLRRLNGVVAPASAVQPSTDDVRDGAEIECVMSSAEKTCCVSFAGLPSTGHAAATQGNHAVDAAVPESVDITKVVNVSVVDDAATVNASAAAGSTNGASGQASELSSSFSLLADSSTADADAVQKAEVADCTSAPASSRLGTTQGILGLLSKWEVWMHILNPFFWGACSSSVEALWPLLATSNAISDDNMALGVTLNGVGFLTASIVTTALGQRQYDRCLLYLLAAAMCGACVLVVPAVPFVFGSYAALSALFGWWLGIVVSLLMGVLSEAVEPRDFSTTIALYNFMNGLGYFVGPILIGSMGSSVGESTNWIVCGCFSVAASLVVVPPYVALRRRRKATAGTTTAATAGGPKGADGE